MAGAARFLYGLALGISLGIIGSRLAAAASSGTHRRPARNGRFRAWMKVTAKQTEKQEASSR